MNVVEQRIFRRLQETGGRWLSDSEAVLMSQTMD